MKPTCILFDLDNTLVDRPASLTRYANRFARDFGDRLMDGYFGLDRLYLHIFRLRELRRLLRRSGFRIERELLLNDARTGPIANGRFRGIRANGFLITPEEGGEFPAGAVLPALPWPPADLCQ